jgi:hypothetical protein
MTLIGIGPREPIGPELIGAHMRSVCWSLSQRVGAFPPHASLRLDNELDRGAHVVHYRAQVSRVLVGLPLDCFNGFSVACLSRSSTAEAE